MTNYKVVAEQAIPDWDNQVGGTTYEQMYTAAGGKIDGVLAANDGLGNAVIAINKKNGDPDPGHRAGRDRPGPAEHPRRRPVHDRLQGHREGGRGAVERCHRVGQGREAGPRPAPSQDDTGNRDVAAILLTPEAIYQGERQGRRRTPMA